MKGSLSDTALAERIQTKTKLLDSLDKQPNYSTGALADVADIRADLKPLWTEFARRVNETVEKQASKLRAPDYPLKQARADVWMAVVTELPTANLTKKHEDDPDWDAQLFVAGFARKAARRIHAAEEWDLHGMITNPDVIRARFVIDDFLYGRRETSVKGEPRARPINNAEKLASAVAKDLGQNRANHHRLTAHQVQDYLQVNTFISEADFQVGNELTIFDLFGHTTEDSYELGWYSVLLKYINRRELAVLRHTYGIETERVESQSEIASLMGIDQPTVSRAYASAHKKLRALGRRTMESILFEGSEPPVEEAPVLTRSEMALTA